MRYSKQGDPIDRARWTFGRLLEWHLGRGTRPGKVDHPGPKWSEKEFARAVGVQTDRTIRNWLKNTHPPKDTWKIERALFGADDARYPEWRRELQQAHGRPRGIEKDGDAKDNGASALPDACIEGQSVTNNPLLLSNIAIRVPTHFMGRDDALAAIAAALHGEEGRLAVAITALHGLRGVGKSTLAAAYAERHRGDYRVTWWIRAQADVSLRADLVALGIRLGWIGADDREEPALAAVMERLRQENDRILLVFDNAIDADALRPYLPRGGGARVLVTSNAHAWRGVATPVQIQVWPNDVGADFLIARTGRAAERADAEALSEALGGLPLAHEQAAAYSERLDISLGAYLKRFAAAPAKFLDDTRHAPTEYGLTVAKTFSLAIDEAANLHPAAESLILQAALLAPDPIPLFLFAQAHEKFDEPLQTALAGDGLDEAVAALRAFALVDRETIIDERDVSITTDAIRLHRLVREVAAWRADENGERRRHALIEALVAIYPEDAYEDAASWPRCALLTPHLLSLCSETTDVPADLLVRAGSFFHGRAAYAEARPLFERALAIREKALGPEHPYTARSLNNLALLLLHQGDLAGARPLYERALAVHPDSAAILNNLAFLREAQGDLVGARPLYERALAICEKELGPDDSDTARSLSNLASALGQSGDRDDAEALFKRAIAVGEKTLGSAHRRTQRFCSQYARLLLDTGRAAEALRLAQIAVATHEATSGPNHPWTKESARVVADALAALDRGDEAAALRARYGIKT